jgi:hypothetical protein
MKTLLLLLSVFCLQLSATGAPPFPPKVQPVTVKALTAAMKAGTLTSRQSNYLWSVNDRKTLTAKDVGHIEKGKWVDVNITTHRISPALVADDNVGQFAMLNKMGKPVLAPRVVKAASVMKSMASKSPAMAAPPAMYYIHLVRTNYQGTPTMFGWMKHPPGELWWIEAKRSLDDPEWVKIQSVEDDFATGTLTFNFFLHKANGFGGLFYRARFLRNVPISVSP